MKAMRKTIISLPLSLILMVPLLLSSCTALPGSTDQTHSIDDSVSVRDETDNSYNALPLLAGRYMGTLPCADCEGIRMLLEIFGNGRFRLEETYFAQEIKTWISEGSYTLDERGILVLNRADGKRDLLLNPQSSSLQVLDAEGKPVEGDISALYLLRKLSPLLAGQRFTPVMLYGEQLSPKADSGDQEWYVSFSPENGAFSAWIGCNQIGGEAWVFEAQRIQFTSVFRTLMACPEMLKEDQFLQALDLVDSYFFDGTQLSFFKARMSPVLVLELRGE